MTSNLLKNMGLANIDIGIVILVMIIALLILFILLVVQIIQFNKYKKKYNKFMQGKNARSLEKDLSELSGRISFFFKKYPTSKTPNKVISCPNVAVKNSIIIINYFIVKYDYTSYLEIGLAEGYNFNNVNCESKESRLA